jgi:hypothetical protein
MTDSKAGSVVLYRSLDRREYYGRSNISNKSNGLNLLELSLW